MSDGPVLFTPDGRLIQRDDVLDRAAPRHVTKHLRRWFVDFAAFLTKHALGLHCGLCHETLPLISEAWRHWGECSGHKPIAEDGIAQPVVKTDLGLAWVTGRSVAKVEMKPDAIEWFRQAADVCGHFQLGIHCDRCRVDLSGLNSDADQVYSTACSCREWLGVNREYRPPVPEVVH
jgi:hypothetical protein